MERQERFHLIRRLLHARRSVSLRELLAALEVSRATLFRDLAYLRDRMQFPIEFDPDSNRYRLDPKAERHELPGLWFSAAEIHALLTMQQLLANLDTGGLLGPHIEPLRERLDTLLETGSHPAENVTRRIRIISAAARPYRATHFQAVANALMERRRLAITYRARSSGSPTQREVSPQRLTHYRDNWYLDAWCHLRDELRSFAVDAIEQAEPLPTIAAELPDDLLDGVLGAGYGIFAGAAVRWATLQFTAARARWVAAENWHPEQQGHFLADGTYQLRIPYSNDPELIMDILKYGPDCRVVAPEDLRAKVIGLLKAAAGRYGDA